MPKKGWAQLRINRSADAKVTETLRKNLEIFFTFSL